MAQVKRPLPGSLAQAIQAQIVRPFNLVRLAFPAGVQCMSSGPQVVLENKLRYSSSLENAAWGKAANVSVVANADTIDGTPVDYLSNTPSLSSYIRNDFTVTQGQTLTRVMYVKRITGADLLVFESDIGTGAYATAAFNLTAGTCTFTAGSPATIKLMPNGLYRCAHTVTFTGATSPRANVYYVGAYGSTPLATTFAVAGAQVFTGPDDPEHPYVETLDTVYLKETYVPGLVDVGEFTWGPDGSQSGQIELFNENNSAVALVLGNGVDDVACDIYECYAYPDGSGVTTPVQTVKGVLTDSDITPTSAVISVHTTRADVEHHPRRYVTPQEGFNWLPPDGGQVLWGNELYVFERS